MLLKTRLVALALASLASASPDTTPKSTTSTSTTPSQTLNDCLGAKNVPIKLVSSSDWSTYVATYNARLPYTPVVVALPLTPKNVADAVTCGAQAGVKIQAKSGGHSYASFSTGGQDGSMVIDMRNFQTISVDANGIATAGAGVRLGNLALGIYNKTKRALPHGTCPGIGIGGHMTHGGYGYTSRKWGLALDAIVGLDVVLANGTLVRATLTAYPEIFWAMRGAADSFGIITAFYLQTLEAPKSIINFKYEFKGLFTSVSKISSFFSHVQDFALNSSVVDDSLGGLGMYMENGELELRGIYFGSLEDYRTKLEPEMLRTLPAPATPPTVEPLGWLESLLLWGRVKTLATNTANYSVSYNFFAKSVSVPDASPLNAAALNSYFSYMIQQGPSSPTPYYAIINLYGGPGSAINTKDTAFSAYAHRDTLWVVEHQANMPVGKKFPDSALPWLDGLTTNLTSQMPDANFGAYLNYVDPSLAANKAHRLYYGKDVYKKLKSIKTVVDPNNVFSNPQSI